MAMLGVSWSQPTKKICLGLILGRLIAWVTYDVCKMIVRTLCTLPLAMKHFGVMHRLQFMSKGMIHLGVHNHPIVDGKCRESIKETKRLIAEEVDHMPDAKISLISFSVSKTFLANYLLDDSRDGIVEFLKGEQLEQIQDKFCELSSPNVHNLVAFFKHHSRGGYIDNIFELKSMNWYDYV
jgi:hypothetical protein